MPAATGAGGQPGVVPVLVIGLEALRHLGVTALGRRDAARARLPVLDVLEGRRTGDFMSALMSRSARRLLGRAPGTWRGRVPRLAEGLAFIVAALAWLGTIDAHAGPPVTIVNALPRSPVCPNGNSVSVFAPGQQVIHVGGAPLTVTGDFSALPGIGIQVNNWYWTSVQLPVQRGDLQNPDNSGAQFAISDQCVLSQQPAWYGKGIPTYLIAGVTAQKTAGGCTITISPNAYTNAVTPGCCAPPGIGSNTCAGPWGITNNHVGEPWPPR